MDESYLDGLRAAFEVCFEALAAAHGAPTPRAREIARDVARAHADDDPSARTARMIVAEIEAAARQP